MDIDGFLIRVSIALAYFFVAPLVSTSQDKGAIDIRINTQTTYQTISNFGASDAWSCQFVGNWPVAAKDSIANWLFSLDTLANGSPAGIGLSLWRFNIGAGSTQQGDSSGIQDEWRRAESFIEDGRYNWRRQQGQQWFLKAAKQRGVQQFLGFFNSPPVPYTTNGKAYAGQGKCNIDNRQYGAFANYAAAVIKGVRQATGVGLDYISPVNEPQWDWSDGGQEGCPYTNREISAVVKAFDAALVKNKLTTQILIPESGQHQYLWQDGNKPGRGDQVHVFFNPMSPYYTGNLSHVAKVAASHSYFTAAPLLQAMATRQKIAQTVAAEKGLSYWQSEYCILGDNAGEISGGKRDLGMNAALHIARVIYADLVGANATAWQWWLAISPYDYKDGLIYIDKNKTGGRYYDSKMLWALGNYSRFVRPGMKRVEVGSPATDSVLVSAYTDTKEKKLVVVVVNSSSVKKAFTITGPAGSGIDVKSKWTAFTTSQSANLKKHSVLSGRLEAPPNSVVTFQTLCSDL